MAGRSLVPLRRPLDAILRALPSKSVTHRALVAAALADGASVLEDVLLADDTGVTLDGLRALGIDIAVDSDGTARVRGASAEIPGGARISLHDSGTSMRFLLAVSALGRSPSRLDGSERLRQRPLSELARALVSLGAAVSLPSQAGLGLPATAGGTLPVGGTVRLAGGTSSQFASALLLVGPRLARGLELVLEPPLVSLPYVELTVQVLEAFGARVERGERGTWRVGPGAPRPTRFRVEGDHSTASYFLAAAAVVGGRVRVTGLHPSSAQPDARLGAVLERAGCRVRYGTNWVEVQAGSVLRPLDEDLTDAPDLAPTLAVIGLFAEGTTELRGLGHLRHKESDRLVTIAGNLRRFGCRVDVTDDRLRCTPPPRSKLQGGTVDTASDHRIAMAFAVGGLAIDGVAVDDADCVAKSNPRFWEQLSQLER